jgi:L-ascorbate metabolism protein UlaG (beta-lactamase superfamily)
MEDLPPIDAVLISHNHFDHLDLPTLRQLAARGSSTFIVATGGARLLRSEKLEPTRELDWGESLAISACTIHCVSALHFSARGILDRNKTLWCGYVIEYPDSLVYFAGAPPRGDPGGYR